ncbi:MAG TPA: DoxX family membrane protein [Rhodanobacteraceae bacterium]|nr:DoxX family membrane protein [Rhodanobacteraceae bacterium]
MTAENKSMAFGWCVYGLGVMALGMVCLAFGDFHPGQPVPKDFPARTALAFAAAAFMLVAGAAIQWRRTMAWGAAALTAYFALIVVLVMNGRVLLAHYAEYGPYESLAIELAIAAGGLIIYAASARIDAALASRLTRLAQLAFAACALIFGGAHFVYMNLTAPLVPKWLPPSQEFWGYATGLCHIAAGVAILTGVQARLAAILLTVMFASFTPLVHVPMLLADPSSHWIWNENAVNLALIGAAWVVADSLALPRHSPSGSMAPAVAVSGKSRAQWTGEIAPTADAD